MEQFKIESVQLQMQKQQEEIEELKQQLEVQKQQVVQCTRQIYYLEQALNEMELSNTEKKGKRGRPKISDVKKQQVRNLVEQGMSYRSVSEQTGVSLGMISAIMSIEDN